MSLLAHARLTLHGTIGASQTWSTGIGLSAIAPDVPLPDSLQSYLTAADPSVSTWWSTVCQPLNGNDVTLTKMTMTWTPAGSDKAAAVAEHPFLPALFGSSSAASLPTYTALVVSTISNKPGRSGRGRMYVPMTKYGLVVHQVEDSQLTTVAQGTALLMRTLAGLLAGIYTPAICGKAGNFTITSVKVDSLPDVQHRREDKVAALATEIAVV